jgi:uncharacterized OsmC-like protein
VELQTGDQTRSIVILPRENGFGSSVNGAELLSLALATCYCNDIYREAAKKGIQVTNVEVQVEGDALAEGAPMTNVSYRAKVKAKATVEEIQALMKYTDTVAEIQNTLRRLTPVTLGQIEAVNS